MFDVLKSPFEDTPSEITWLVSMEPYVVELRSTAGLVKTIVPPVLNPPEDPAVVTHAVEYRDEHGFMGHRSVMPIIIKMPPEIKE
jgi:hypothetical protein